MISVIATAESSETGGNGEVSTNTQMSGNPSYQELARIAGNIGTPEELPCGQRFVQHRGDDLPLHRLYSLDCAAWPFQPLGCA